MLGEAIIKKLRSIVGPENVIDDTESCIPYSSDASLWKGEPDVVIRPRDTGEVVRVIALAYENSIPVTPRGAGTGLSGGSIPAGGGIVLSTERMNAAPQIHKEDLYAEVSPGVVTEKVRKLVEAEGLFYPPDPASQAACTIGGNIAECATGLRSLKYGTTRRYVLGMEVVTPEGGVLFAGARTVKSVAGYDVARLMVGSEGTLGVITSAVLRLLPLPQSRLALTAGFSDITTASEAVSLMLGGGLLPAALEIMDGTCTRAVSSYLKENLGGDVLVLAEFDGMPSVCEESSRRAARLLKDEFRADVRMEAEPGDSEEVWRARRAVIPALRRLRPSLLIEDITVPWSRLAAMVEGIVKIGAKYDVQVAVFGHAGDGSIHPAFLADSKDSDEMARVRSAVTEMMQVCVDLEGTASEEYGVGLDRKPFLKLQIGKSGYDIMRSLKDSIDPRGIMNPGKMFLED
jgi:glycolate oxidase